MGRGFAVWIAALAASASAWAYTPGTGSLYTENFDDGTANDWTTNNDSTASAWAVAAYGSGGDKVYDADGQGQGLNAPTLHVAYRPIHPVPAGSFSTAFFYRADGGAGFTFRVDIEQRAPGARKYRLEVDANGRLSIQRANNGPFTVLAATADNFVAFNQDRWMRFTIDGDGTQQFVRARVWSHRATSEPADWDLSAADPLLAVERVNRMTLTNDGPRGQHTRIDDLEIWGDKSQGVVSSIKTIYICEWSHLDIGFTETPQAIEQYYKDTLDQVIANLKADPGYKWTIEEYWMLDQWLRRSTEAQKQEMFGFLRSGRIHLAAGHSSLTVGVVGHEEFARQIYPALELARRENFPVRSYILDDVPGAPFNIPELLAKSGVEYYLGGLNTAFGGAVTHPGMAERPFWWQGPDGRKVLAWHTFDGYAEAFDYGFSWFDTFADMFRKLGVKLPDNEAYGYPHDTLMIWKAFDNNYTGFWVKQRVDQWNATYATPKFVLAQPEEFMDLMKQRLGDAIPTFTGDYGPAWSAATGNHEMQQLRAAREELRPAEALGAVADLVGAGGDPRPTIRHGYEQLLVSDEHSGGGSWTGYYDQQEMIDSISYFQNIAADAWTTAHGALNSAAAALASQVPARGRDSLVVFNGLVFARDAWVRAALPAELFDSVFRLWDRAAGVELPYQRYSASSEILFRASGLPPLGYRVYDLAPGAPAAPTPGLLTVSGTVLENDFYRITVDPADGAVSSLLWKPGGLELVDSSAGYRFNRLAHASHNDVFFGAAPTAEEAGGPTVTVGDAGPLTASLVVTRAATPHGRAEFRLHRGEDRVEIVNQLDRSRMPYIAGGDTIYYSVSLPFNLHNFNIRSERPNRFFDPVADNFARPSLFPYHDAEHALDFWDQIAGVTYACDATPTHDFERMATYLDAVPRTNALLWPRLVSKSDEYQYNDGLYHPVDYEPGTSPLYEFHHYFRAHGASHDPVEATRFGFGVLAPAPVQLIRDQDGSLPADSAAFLECDDPAVKLYTVKRGENGPGLVLRLAELAGSARTVRISSALLSLSNPRLLSMIEEDREALSMDGADGFLVPLGPYETVTVGVDASFPVLLKVGRNSAAAAVRLSWLGGTAPFTVERASRADFTDGAPVGEGLAARAFDDPVLNDGRTWFYRIGDGHR